MKIHEILKLFRVIWLVLITFTLILCCGLLVYSVGGSRIPELYLLLFIPLLLSLLIIDRLISRANKKKYEAIRWATPWYECFDWSILLGEEENDATRRMVRNVFELALENEAEGVNFAIRDPTLRARINKMKDRNNLQKALIKKERALKSKKKEEGLIECEECGEMVSCEIMVSGDAEACCLCGIPSEPCQSCFDRHIEGLE